MKYQSRVALFLVLVLITTILCSCSNDDGQGVAPSSTTAEGTQPAISSEEDAAEEKSGLAGYFPLAENETLTMWYVWMSDLDPWFSGPEELPFFIELQKRTNVTIDFTTVSQLGATEAFTVMVAGGDYTHLAKNAAVYYAGGISQAISDGVYYDLAEHMDDYMPNFKALLDSDPTLLKDSSNDAGQIGAAHLMQSKDVPLVGPAIRKDWLDAVGMSIPETYDDYYNVLTAFKVDLGIEGALSLYDAGAPFSDYFIAGYDVSGYIGSMATNGYGLFCIWDGEVIFTPYTDNYREYITMVRQWYSEKLIYQDYFTGIGSQASEIELLNAGKLGIIYTPSSNLFENLIGGEEGASLVGIPDAKKTADQQLHIRNGGSRVVSTASLSVSTSAEDKLETVMRWLDYWYSEEGTMLHNYGIEDVTYTLDANGDIAFTELVTNNPDGMASMQVFSAYGAGGMTGYNVTDGKNAISSPALLEARELWAEADTDYVYPKTVSMTQSETEVFSLYYGDIQTYVLETVSAFIVGTKSLDEWDDFITNLEGLHVEECLEVKRTAYARYVAR